MESHHFQYVNQHKSTISMASSSYPTLGISSSSSCWLVSWVPSRSSRAIFSAAPPAALGAANAATAFRSVSCSNFCRNAVAVAVEVGEMAKAWENVSWIFFDIRILQGFTLISLILLIFFARNSGENFEKHGSKGCKTKAPCFRTR